MPPRAAIDYREKITAPTLVLDGQKCRQNIARMLDKARANSVAFRPHFKTHQSRCIGKWFKEAGVNAITVSSVRMAQYFAADGVADIVIAVPANIRQKQAINALAHQISLSCLIVSASTAVALDAALTAELGVFIEIDCGYHRTGILREDTAEIAHVLAAIKSSKKLVFKGFLTHAGNAYEARSPDEIRAIHNETTQKMRSLKAEVVRDWPEVVLSIGDTPCCSIADDFLGMDEIRPGNFVFYDVMQAELGSCATDHIGVALACPIIATYPDRGEVVVYGGAIHLGKESLITGDGRPSYGAVVPLTTTGWHGPIPGASVRSISQEHGIISLPRPWIDNYQPGHLLGVLPIHSCLTAQAAGGYLTTDGEVFDHLSGMA
ncbi:MAG: alanine racemase [Myxococcota bacterium]|nr:alanine racemase [Myxococcota bacterium]